MTVIENRPSLDRPSLEFLSATESNLAVDRTDISFYDVGNGLVRIEVRVRNTGWQRTPPTTITLQSAPFGAFAPWRPLTQLVVPALDAGGSHVVGTEAERPRPAILGDFDRVPPDRLLTAVNAPGESLPTPNSDLAALRRQLAWRRVAQRTELQPRSRLAPDLWDLVGRSQMHWAGNINVFIGKHPVERHLARSLRIYPGRVNLAMFCVGESGKPDQYSFKLVGLDPEWQASLSNAGLRRSLLPDEEAESLPASRWVVATNGLMVHLRVQPPLHCGSGKLEVHVTQRSTQKTALVEFDLDPRASGPGCYYL